VTTVKFWAIADTHLSLGKPRDLSKFGDIWINHTERLEADWRQKVRPQDKVLILGDISWSSTVRRAMYDLEWLAELPGEKIIIRGNHDRWWTDIKKVRRQVLPAGFYAVQGDTYEVDGVLFCGAQGHLAPHDPFYKPDPPHNRYQRELKTLKEAVKAVKKVRKAEQPLVVMMHYPPYTSDAKPTEYSDLVEQLAPAMCLYGHLHQPQEWEIAFDKQYQNGIYYRLLSADYVKMELQAIDPFQYGK